MFLDRWFRRSKRPATRAVARRRLRLERLEPRQLLAVGATHSISGTVFNDLNGNTIQDGAEPGILGAQVQLLADNNPANGVLDPVEALAPVDTDVTPASGDYVFANLAEGTYFVRQLANPGLGLMEMTSGPIVLAETAGTVIDPFDTTAQQVVEPAMGPIMPTLSMVAPEAIGNVRDMSVEETSNIPGEDAGMRVFPATGQLQFNPSFAGVGSYLVAWDGDVGTSFNPSLNEDLTDGGASTGIQFNGAFDLNVAQSVDYMVTIESATGTWTAMGTISTTGAQEIFIPFTSFMDGGSSGQASDFTNAQGIQLAITTDDAAVDGQLSLVGAVGPTMEEENFPNQLPEPEIQIEKSTNGVDADDPPGVELPVGDPVTFTYMVTNPGNVPLEVTSIFDNGGPGPSFVPDPILMGGTAFNVGDTNMDNLLDTDETWQYTSAGVVVQVAAPGQYTNTATVNGRDPFSDMTVSDTDDSNHFGRDFRIELEKATNAANPAAPTTAEDADTPPGQSLPVGTPLTWTYLVSNPGNVSLSIISLTDDGGPNASFNPDPVEVAGEIVGDTDMDGFLDPGETWQYTSDGVVDRDVVAGQYTNNATVVAIDEDDIFVSDPPTVDDSDPSNHFGVNPMIVVEKATNAANPAAPTAAEDADTDPGQLLAIGTPLTWTYLVTNPGNVELQVTNISDDGGPAAGFTPTAVTSGAFNVGDTDMDNMLDTTETWQYTSAGVVSRNVLPGQYTNTASVTGFDPLSGLEPEDEDPSNHFGVNARLQIEKATNAANPAAPTGAEDADTAPGRSLAIGTPLTWTYLVSNPGNVPMQITNISDDGGPDAGFTPTAVTSGGFNVGDANMDNMLDTDETWQFTSAGVVSRNVVEGQYTNLSTVNGVHVASGLTDDDTDPSNYFGVEVGIQMQKATNAVDPAMPTNAEDADAAPGQGLAVGTAVTWTYRVINEGNVALAITEINDDMGTPANMADDFTPAAVTSGGFNVGDTDNDGLLDVDEIWRYTSQGVATYDVQAGQYTNTAMVMGTDPISEASDTDSDPSNHFGVMAGIAIEKATNGSDADSPTGPFLPVDSTATFDYVVNNTGNTPLADVVVTDSRGVAVSFIGGDSDGDMRLDVGETWTYRGSSTVVAGQYNNVGMVTANPVDETGSDLSMLTDVAANDPSNHFGAEAGINIEKSTNNQDADEATGPNIAVDDTATFRYVVTNTGNVQLATVVVTDNQGVTPIFQSGDTDGDLRLDTNETWIYEATRTVTAGQYTNIGSVNANPVDNDGADISGLTNVSDSDPSNHFGVMSSIDIEKFTEGQDADAVGSGPTLFVGDTVNFRYEVRNTGNVNLTNVVVTDNRGVTPVLQSGDDGDGVLELGEVWVYTASGTVVLGDYENLGTVVATDPLGMQVNDEDLSHHRGDPLPSIPSKRRFLSSALAANGFVI